MARRIHLTDIALRALKPTHYQVTYWDETLPAFGVRVGRRSKTFVIVQNGGRRKKVGSYPATQLKAARKAAKLLLASPAAVTDHVSPKTVHEATIEFVETRAQKNRAITKLQTERTLQRFLLPKLGTKLLTEVTTDHVMSIVASLKDTPATAINTFVTMRTFFNWTVARRYLKQSPLAGLSLPAKRKERDRVLSNAELTAIYRAATEMGYPFGYFVLICIHYGASIWMRRRRRSEMGCGGR